MTGRIRTSLIYVGQSSSFPGFSCICSCRVPDQLPMTTRPDSDVLRRIARDDLSAVVPRPRIVRSELSVSFDGPSVSSIDLSLVSSALRKAGYTRDPSLSDPEHLWYAAAPHLLVRTLKALRTGDGLPGRKKRQNADKKEKEQKKAVGHAAADALDWEEAMDLIDRLKEDGRYREAMIIASGCYLGLRVSDFRTLRWCDILKGDTVTVALTEVKTGKTRKMRLNRDFVRLAGECFDSLGVADENEWIIASMRSGTEGPLTRQRIDQLLKELKVTYGIRSAEHFSAHTLRKTFGRRVWLRECESGRGDQALVLLQDVFGHSSVNITKRYLGIREEEILSVYDALT